MSVSINVLLVAGGGGGWAWRAWGGGGGWVIDTTQSLSFGGDLSVSVGNGWLGSTDWTSSAWGAKGGNSTFNWLSAIWGGGGMNEGGGSNTNGWSGGGGTAPWNAWGTGTSWQWNAWGTGWPAGNYCAGGGGGSGWAGANGTSSTCGNGGSWHASSISGTSVNYGGGGGGGGNGWTPGTGTDGGWNWQVSAWTPGTNWTDWLGWGWGGGSGTVSRGNGWNGGKGVVIISYVTGTLTATGWTVTTSGGNTIHTFTSSGTFTVSSLPIAPNATLGEYFGASLRLTFNGDSSDSSGNGFDATPTNMAFWPWKSGSACAIFNGTNSKEYVPFNSTLNTSWAVTVGWLFKFSSLSWTKYLGMRWNLAVDWSFVAQATAWIWIEFLTHTSPNDNYLNTGFIPTNWQWYFIVFRFVPWEMSVFLDGEIIATKSVGSSLRTSASYGWTIGDSYNGWNVFDGEMDSFFIETRWWTDQEIRKRNTDFRWMLATL